jgi:lysophospholipase L1-like esterase
MIFFDTVVTVVLSPLLLVQAMGLRKRALRLPEADGPRSGTVGTGSSLRVFIVGDSSAAGVGVSTQDDALAGQLARALATQHTVHWHLIASTGATTKTTLERMTQEILPAADVVVMILGVNDVTRGGPQSAWLHSHARLRALLRTKTGAKDLFISQIPPLGDFPLLPHPLRWLLGRRAVRFDAALRKALRAEADTRYVDLPATLDPIDMAEDGFHPGPRIYALWAKEMARQILSDRP